MHNCASTLSSHTTYCICSKVTMSSNTVLFSSHCYKRVENHNLWHLTSTGHPDVGDCISRQQPNARGKWHVFWKYAQFHIKFSLKINRNFTRPTGYRPLLLGHIAALCISARWSLLPLMFHVLYTLANLQRWPNWPRCVWAGDSSWLKEPCGWGHDPQERTIFFGGGTSPTPMKSHATVWCQPCKKAEPIIMPSGMWNWTSPRNHVLDDGPQLQLFICFIKSH